MESAAERWWTRRRRTSRNYATCAADADGVLTARAAITRRVIEAMERCRIIVRYGIGVDTVDIPAATERGIMVANVPDYCVDEVSDHALTLLLMLSRQMISAIALARQDRWVMTQFPPAAPAARADLRPGRMRENRIASSRQSEATRNARR